MPRAPNRWPPDSLAKLLGDELLGAEVSALPAVRTGSPHHPAGLPIPKPGAPVLLSQPPFFRAEADGIRKI
jgi:hypothetical protein